MKISSVWRRGLVALVLWAAMTPHAAGAGEIGHYAPGVPSVRDFAMPDRGLYAVVYDYWYGSQRLNDRNGDPIETLIVPPGPGPGTTIDVDIDLSLFALSPVVLWVSNVKVLGAEYGVYGFATIANSSLAAALSTQTGSGREVETSTFGMGDLYLQPLWLGWKSRHWNTTFGYGFYAPIGKYETEIVTLPVAGPFRTESVENVGFGFWTHQLQAATTWYPLEHHGTAAFLASTWEIHGEKQDFDLTPGQNLAVNWGLSQYVPLQEDQSMLLEVGLTGYGSWQITDDRGGDAHNPSVHDEVHAAGGQLGLTVVPWNAALNLRYLAEFSAVDRFQGSSFGFNIAFEL